MAVDTQSARLDRIEEKIDRLSEAMIALARAEERLMSIEANNTQQYLRMNKLSEKIDALDDAVKETQRTTSTINRLFWAILVGGIGAFFANITYVAHAATN